MYSAADAGLCNWLVSEPIPPLAVFFWRLSGVYGFNIYYSTKELVVINFRYWNVVFVVSVFITEFEVIIQNFSLLHKPDFVSK